MRSPSAVVFDVGNVLIEWDRERLYSQLIPDDRERAEFFTTIMPMQVNLVLDGGVPFRAVLSALADVHPMYAAEILAFEHRWDETLGPQDDEMVGLVEELRDSGVGVYGLTNFSHETWPIALERHPWLGDFDGVVVSGQEGIVKPDPAIYEVLLDRYDLDPSRTWFTDDSQANIDGAAAVGMMTSLFVDARSTRAVLSGFGLAAESSTR